MCVCVCIVLYCIVSYRIMWCVMWVFALISVDIGLTCIHAYRYMLPFYSLILPSKLAKSPVFISSIFLAFGFLGITSSLEIVRIRIPKANVLLVTETNRRYATIPDKHY
ncbi:hypothetical protein BDF22DRAFT_293597 [Syncephalis plumigaleata]|nr:hypothetical protein BDF22DRAFT_293597 [Syncephalis plumigaleata]